MSHQTNTRTPGAKRDPPFLSPAAGQEETEVASGSQKADLFVWVDGCAYCHDDLIGKVNCLVERMNHDQEFLIQLAEFKNITLVLSATDTGRELMIMLNEEGVCVRPYAGEPFDVKIQATEQVLWAVLFGEMDADTAFFSGRAHICGSMVTAFRVKNRFLSLLQRHLARECQATDKSLLTNHCEKGGKNE